MEKNLKIILIVVGIIIGVMVVSGLVADYLLRQNLGIGLFDLFAIASESVVTFEEAVSFSEELREEIGEENYTLLVEQKTEMDETFRGIQLQLEEAVNSNPELTENLRINLGESYSIYLFSIYTQGNLTFKVFEWSVGTTSGNITTFESGKTMDEYNVIIQMDQSIAPQVLTGEASSEEIITWVTEQKIKINPIMEVMKVMIILPAIISAIPA